MRFQGTTIASLSRSSEFWGLLAALTATQIQQAGIPNVIDIPGDVRSLALGGYFEKPGLHDATGSFFAAVGPL